MTKGGILEEKMTLGKNQGDLNKGWTLGNNNVSVLFINGNECIIIM